MGEDITSQDLVKDMEKAIEAIWSIDLDKLREQIRSEVEAELRTEIREELRDEIRAELEDACNAAADSEAPEIGDDLNWGQDDATGLAHFLTFFDENWSDV